MRYVIFFLFCTIPAYQSCNKGLSQTHQSDECKTYYNFIASEWITVENHYELKGRPPYWNLEYFSKYFSEQCLIGLPEKQIKKLFGEPSRISTYKQGWKTVVYCFDEECLTERGKRFEVDINASGIVVKIYSSPTPNGLESVGEWE